MVRLFNVISPVGIIHVKVIFFRVFLEIYETKKHLLYLYKTFTLIITLVQNSISYEKFSSKIFHRRA